jgi:CheY-like chemotaxis protein
MVTVSNDGEEVLALTREHDLRVILTDCPVCSLDGYGAMAALLDHEKAAWSLHGVR